MNLADASPSAMAVGACVFDRASARVQPRPRFIIWRIIDSGPRLTAEAFPVTPAAEPFHRSDVVLDSGDAGEMGIPISASFASRWVVRTGERVEIRPAIRLGQCPVAVWQAIARALRQTRETARAESTSLRRRLR